MLIERFDLSPERARGLHEILKKYEQELESVRNRHLAEYTSRMEPDLRERNSEYNAMIRDLVLPESARAEFDELQGGVGLPW